MYAYQNQKYHMLIIQHHFFGFVALDLVFFDTKVWRAHQQKFDLFLANWGAKKAKKWRMRQQNISSLVILHQI